MVMLDEKIVHDIFNFRTKYLRARIKELKAAGKETRAGYFDLLLHETELMKAAMLFAASSKTEEEIESTLTRLWSMHS